MRRLLAALILTGLAGCGGGYLHTHPHVCQDGNARTHRHWHSEDSTEGHHRPEGTPRFHRESAFGD